MQGQAAGAGWPGGPGVKVIRSQRTRDTGAHGFTESAAVTGARSKVRTPPNGVLLTRAGFLCFHVPSLLKLTSQEKAMPHRETHDGVRKILVRSLHNVVLVSGSSSLLIYRQLSSPSSPVPCLRAGSDFLSAASQGHACVQSHRMRNEQLWLPLRSHFRRGPTSPACTRTRSSQMPWTQSALEPPSQSLYLDSHWGPWVSGEHWQLLVTQERNVRACVRGSACFLASIIIPVVGQCCSCGIIHQRDPIYWLKSWKKITLSCFKKGIE